MTYSNNEESQYENYKDVDIPKRLKVDIEEGLTIMITDSNQKLAHFVTRKGEDRRGVELFYLNLTNLTFELLRTLRNSYYITI